MLSVFQIFVMQLTTQFAAFTLIKVIRTVIKYIKIKHEEIAHTYILNT